MVELLRAEIHDLEQERNNVICENRRLQSEMYQTTQEVLHAKRLLESSKTELEELRLQVQQYCYELKHIEELLNKKEIERSDLLKHLKFFSQETADLENNNQCLDTELKRCRQQLTDAEKEIMRLETCVQDKECCIKSLEDKLQELSCLTSQLEEQLQSTQREKYHQNESLAQCQDTLQQLVRQKEVLCHQLGASEKCKAKIENELQERKGVITNLQDQLNKERCHSSNLEDVLRQTRTEMHDVCLCNKRYQEEVACLTEKMEILSEKLQEEQEKNECFHQNIESIRKEITGARYSSMQPAGDTKDRYVNVQRRDAMEKPRAFSKPDSPHKIFPTTCYPCLVDPPRIKYGGRFIRNKSKL